MPTTTPDPVPNQEFGEVLNFVDRDGLAIAAYARDCAGDFIRFVCIEHYAGSLRLQHSMRSEQAREMAAMLLSAADYVEQVGRFAAPMKHEDLAPIEKGVPA